MVPYQADLCRGQSLLSRVFRLVDKVLVIHVVFLFNILPITYISVTADEVAVIYMQLEICSGICFM